MNGMPFESTFALLFCIFFIYLESVSQIVPIPVVERSKAWVYGCSLTGIVGSNPAGVMDVGLL